MQKASKLAACPAQRMFAESIARQDAHEVCVLLCFWLALGPARAARDNQSLYLLFCVMPSYSGQLTPDKKWTKSPDLEHGWTAAK